MTDNFFAVFVLFVLIIVLGGFIYKFYELSKTSKKRSLKTSEFNLLLEEVDDIDGFSYFLNEKPINYEDFEKEKLFLLQYLEKNSNSLDQLANTHELIEIYIDFKLNNTPEPQQKTLMSFYIAHYDIVRDLLNKKFEEKSSDLMNRKMSNSSFGGQTIPKGIEENSLAVKLFKLKTK